MAELRKIQYFNLVLNQNINSKYFVAMKGVTRLSSGRIKYRGNTFSGFNKPRNSWRDDKKFVVLAKKGDKIKIVHYGDPNMPIRKNEPARRKSFRARHRCSTAKDKFSARYWSCKKW